MKKAKKKNKRLAIPMLIITVFNIAILGSVLFTQNWQSMTLSLLSILFIFLLVAISYYWPVFSGFLFLLLAVAVIYSLKGSVPVFFHAILTFPLIVTGSLFVILGAKEPPHSHSRK